MQTNNPGEISGFGVVDSYNQLVRQTKEKIHKLPPHEIPEEYNEAWQVVLRYVQECLFQRIDVSKHGNTVVDDLSSIVAGKINRHLRDGGRWANPIAEIRVVCRNAFLDELDRSKAQKRRGEEQAWDDKSEGVLKLHPDIERSRLSDASQDNLERSIRALDRLAQQSEKWREMVVLFKAKHLDEQTLSEIAKMHGMSIKKVWGKIKKVQTLMRQELKNR